MSREITTVVDGLTFSECPRWHEGRIWFVDFYTHRVLSAEEDGSDLRTEAEVPAQPSGLGWLPDGRMLVMSMRDARLLRREPDGTLVTRADRRARRRLPERHGRRRAGPGVRRQLRLRPDGGAPVAAAALLRVDPDGGVTAVAQDMWFSNGSVITDAGVLIVDETSATGCRVRHRGRRSLANRRTWARFAELPTASDLHEALGQLVNAPAGAAWTPRRALWIADAVGARLLRVREGGRLRRRDRCRHRGVR